MSFRLLLLLLLTSAPAWAAGGGGGGDSNFPPKLDSYGDAHLTSPLEIILHRVQENPFNLAAFIIFVLAICHTFLAGKFMAMAHDYEHAHKEKKKRGEVKKSSVSMRAGIFHFLGEVEVVFGIWGVVLIGAISVSFDWHTAVDYVAHTVNYTEPLFVVVIMTLASTRPILKLSELMMEYIANRFGGTLTAWWLVLLTIGPILGSFITEPAAMTITALLLSQKFYRLGPSKGFAYATLGLLFVNISVGGTLTHFAAPPVLMVASPWKWDMWFMMTHFGWKAIMGILIANGLIWYFYRKELDKLQTKYNVVKLEHELRYHFMGEKELTAILDEMEASLNKELGFKEAFDQKAIELKDEIYEKIVERVVGQEIDNLSKDEIAALWDEYFDKTFKGYHSDKMSAIDMFEWAFEKRFEEIKMSEMRRTLPGLLPEKLRAPYRDPNWDQREDSVPLWIMIMHIAFMGWTVVNAHYPALFIGGFMFFLGFSQVTEEFQNRNDLKPALLVGFFLAGLVIHGGVQGWWIEPVLSSLGEVPLMLSAIVLTAFNDNAAITYLSTLVPNFTAELKYAVVAGAVTGGGLTVIANAPNPAGVSILKGHFKGGVSPAGLAKAALLPTIIMALCFLYLPQAEFKPLPTEEPAAVEQTHDAPADDHTAEEPEEASEEH